VPELLASMSAANNQPTINLGNLTVDDDLIRQHTAALDEYCSSADIPRPVTR
jgi:hypothetical protein